MLYVFILYVSIYAVQIYFPIWVRPNLPTTHIYVHQNIRISSSVCMTNFSEYIIRYSNIS